MFRAKKAFQKPKKRTVFLKSEKSERFFEKAKKADIDIDIDIDIGNDNDIDIDTECDMDYICSQGKEGNWIASPLNLTVLFL